MRAGPSPATSLPAPVVRYLEVAYPDGAPEVGSVVMEGSGRFRRRPLPWIPIRVRISLRPGIDRVSDMTVVLGPVTLMKVLDAYVDGRGITKFLNRADVGAEIDQGSLHPMLCEALMFPSGWSLIPGFTWGAADHATARLRVPFGDGTEVATVGFDGASGFPSTYEVSRFKGTEAKVDWRLDMLEWRRFGPVVAPSRIVVSWADEPGPWLKVRFEKVTTGEDVGEALERALAAIQAATSS